MRASRLPPPCAQPHLLLELRGLSALAAQAPSLQHLHLAGCMLHCHPQFSGLPQHQQHVPQHQRAMAALAAAAAQQQQHAGSGASAAQARAAQAPRDPVTLLGALSELRTLNLSNTACNMHLASSVVGMRMWRPQHLVGLNLR